MYFFHFYHIFDRNSCEQTASVDPDQTSVASDLGLHCLLISQKWDARLIRVKIREKTVHSYKIEQHQNHS